jgi:hypothetical protein
MEHQYLMPIGQVAVFYLPKAKLDYEEYSVENRTPRNQIHHFCMNHHGAYTVEESAIVGFWKSKDQRCIREDNVRYEVSFSGGDRVEEFINFLSEICGTIEEEAIYLTMGYKSYLVLPKKEGSSEV